MRRRHPQHLGEELGRKLQLSLWMFSWHPTNILQGHPSPASWGVGVGSASARHHPSEKRGGDISINPRGSSERQEGSFGILSLGIASPLLRSRGKLDIDLYFPPTFRDKAPDGGRVLKSPPKIIVGALHLFSPQRIWTLRRPFAGRNRPGCCWGDFPS